MGGRGIPAAIGSLTTLRHLDLSFNQFNGTVPAALGSLTALTYLSLNGSELLDGVLPAGFAGASSLQFVDISGTSYELVYGVYAADISDFLVGSPPMTPALTACCVASVLLTSDIELSSTLVVDSVNINITGACATGRAAPACAVVMTAPLLRHLEATDVKVTLQGLELLNGAASYSSDSDIPVGGSVLLKGSSTLAAHNCKWWNNTAASFGGAIGSLNLAAGAVQLTDCVLDGNAQSGGPRDSSLSNDGGSAIFANGDVQLLRCNVSNNTATSSGAVSARLGLSAIETIFSANAAASGGAIFTFRTPLFSGVDCPGAASSTICESGVVSWDAVAAAVNLTSCAFSGNSAVNGDGGAVFLSAPSAPSLNANGSVFIGNAAAGNGGALSIGGGAVNIAGCALQSNRAGVSGGGLALAASSVVLTSLACANNSATTAGGCVLATDASNFLINGSSAVAGNKAARGGGVAFACTSAPCATAYFVAGATFSANSATLQGGGVHVQGGGLYMQDSALTANTAAGNSAQAGGLFVTEFSGLPLTGVVLTRVNFTSNAVVLTPSLAAAGTLLSSVAGSGFGGAFVVSAVTQPPAQLNFTGGVVASNAAASGAGGYVYGAVALSVNGTSFLNNTAGADGGGLFLQPAGTLSATLSGATFAGNAASGAGGAIALASGATLSSSSGVFSNNAAENGAVFFLAVAGAGAQAPPPVVALTGNSASGNVAAMSGGLYYTDATSLIPAPSCTGACSGNAALNSADTLAGVPFAFNCTAAALTVKPGAALSPFGVSLIDSQGSVVVGAPDLTLTVAANVSATAAGGGLSGATAVTYGQGAALFDALSIADVPGTAVRLTYTLHSPSLDLLDGRSGFVDVQLAGCDADEIFDWDSASSHGSKTCLCRPGNFLNASSQRCQPCSPGSYSPAAGAVACTVNPPGFASATQTTFSSNVTLGGVSSATFGAVQNATLSASVAVTLNVSTFAVLISAVTDVPAGRRHTLQSSAAAVAFAVSTTANAPGLRSALGATAAFSSSLSSALRASADPVLSAVTGVTAAAAVESTLVLAAEPCPRGTYLDGLSQQCQTCLAGLVTTSTGATACEPCPPRFAWASAAQCVSCPLNSVTAPSDPARCACQAGYYDAMYGVNATSPACMPCPLGGACTTGYVAAAAGWWREDTRSEVFYQCRVNVCVAENITGPLSAQQLPLPPPGRPSNNCVDGNSGPLCAVCKDGYAMQSGECAPCDAADAWDSWSQRSKGGLLAGCIVAGLVVLALAFLQPVWPGLEHATEAAMEAAANGARRAGDAAMACFRRCCCRGLPDATDGQSKPGSAGSEDAVPSPTRTPAAPDAEPCLESVASMPSRMGLNKHHTRRIDVNAVEHTLASNAAFAAGNVVAFVTEVDGGAEEEDTEGVGARGVERQTDFLDRLEEFMLQFKASFKILINFFRALRRALRAPRNSLRHGYDARAARRDCFHLSQVAGCALAQRVWRCNVPHLSGESESGRVTCSGLPTPIAFILQPIQRLYIGLARRLGVISDDVAAGQVRGCSSGAARHGCA